MVGQNPLRGYATDSMKFIHFGAKGAYFFIENLFLGRMPTPNFEIEKSFIVNTFLTFPARTWSALSPDPGAIFSEGNPMFDGRGIY